MVYPSWPVLETLREFAGTAGTRQTPEQRAALLVFVAVQYRAGRSLREISELTGRTQTAVRRALDQAGVPRRSGGAYSVSDEAARTQRPALRRAAPG